MIRGTGTSFAILGSHGVAEGQIRILERRFGRTIPGVIVGPDDVLQWALSVLPWPPVALVLRISVAKAAKQNGLTDDSDVQDALRLLDTDAPPDVSTVVRDRLDNLVRDLADERGYDLGRTDLEDRRDVDGRFRVLMCAYWATTAAVTAAGGPFDTQSAEAAYRSLLWARSMEDPDLRPYRVDDQIVDLAEQLAEFVGCCVPEGRA